jgi:hypothetical protein
MLLRPDEPTEIYGHEDRDARREALREVNLPSPVDAVDGVEVSVISIVRCCGWFRTSRRG